MLKHRDLKYYFKDIADLFFRRKNVIIFNHNKYNPYIQYEQLGIADNRVHTHTHTKRTARRKLCSYPKWF